MNFSGKEGHPNVQPSTRPGIEPGTSGLGGRDLNHCANPSAISGGVQANPKEVSLLTSPRICVPGQHIEILDSEIAKNMLKIITF